MDYMEIAKRLRNYEWERDDDGKCLGCSDEDDYPNCVDCFSRTHLQAAYAIEQLSNAGSAYGRGWTLGYDAGREESKPRWIPFETRPMDDEERQYYSEQYGFDLADEEAVIYCSQMPDHGQEVLVCNKYGHIWIDTFDDDPDYGVGFETNGDMDGLVAWMPLPEPPKE